MPFYRIDGGWCHVNFGRRKRNAQAPARCVGPAMPGDDLDRWDKCGRMSVALCDFVVGRRVEMGDPMGDRTCDAPVCEHHRTIVGPNVDHCWRHS